MAKIVIEIEDQPDGGLSLCFTGDDVRTARTMATNTPAQNAAIFLAQQLREVGMNAPDLSGDGTIYSEASVSNLDESKYLLSEVRRIGAFDKA